MLGVVLRDVLTMMVGGEVSDVTECALWLRRSQMLGGKE